MAPNLLNKVDGRGSSGTYTIDASTSAEKDALLKKKSGNRLDATFLSPDASTSGIKTAKVTDMNHLDAVTACDSDIACDQVDTTDGVASSPTDSAQLGYFAKYKKFTRTQKVLFLCLGIVNFTSFCSLSLLAPFFPAEAEKKGMSNSTAGLVFSVYSLTSFLFSLFMGKIVPQVGVKTMYFTGIVLTGSSNLLFATLTLMPSTLTFTVFAFLMRITEAIGAAAFNTATFVFIVQIFKENTALAIAMMEAFIGLGFIVGPAFGGVLYWAGGFSLPFITLGSAMLLLIPIMWPFVPDDTGPFMEPGSLWSALKVPGVVVVALGLVLTESVPGFNDPTLQPHVQQFGVSPEMVSFLFLAWSGAYTILSFFWGAVMDRMKSPLPVMPLGMVMVGVGCFMLGPSPVFGFLPTSLVTTIAGLLVLGGFLPIGFIPVFKICLDELLEKGHPDNVQTHGIVSGIVNATISLGFVIGPSFGSYLADTYTYPIACTIMGSMAVAAGAMIAVLCFFKWRAGKYSKTDVEKQSLLHQ